MRVSIAPASAPRHEGCRSRRGDYRPGVASAAARDGPKNPARGHSAWGGVPTVTQADIFLFEDTAGLLLTNYSNGQRNNLMAQATNALLVSEGDVFDFVGFFYNTINICLIFCGISS